MGIKVPVVLMVLTLSMLLFHKTAKGNGDVELYYPPDGTLVSEDVITVEGKVADAEIFELEITVNKEEPYLIPVRDFLFAEEVYLNSGMNSIRVGGSMTKVFFVAEGETPPEGYQRVFGHFGLDNGCAECHVVGEQGNLSFEDGPEEACRWCHGELIRGRRGEDLRSVHRPVSRGECLLCHVPHLSRKPGLPAVKMPECRDCHEETYRRLDSERYVHGPLNLGDCRICHTTHSSKETALLTMPRTQLCTQCHSGIVVSGDVPEELRPHTMIPQGVCGRCHFPHSSDNPRMMKQPSSRLCYDCHPKKTSSFHEKKGFSIYVCQKCHDLHRPTMPHLIIDNSRSLCLECHEFKEEAAFTHEFIREGGCFICHAFHASPLSGEIYAICLKCHGKDSTLGAAHGGLDVNTTKCTLCHLPHQSDKRKLLFPFEHTPFRERDCRACHEEGVASLEGDYRGLCLKCHGDKDPSHPGNEEKEVHPAMEDEDCSYCHASHASSQSGFLREPQLIICLECHRKFKKITVMKPKSSHDYVLRGECHRCHDPHLSANDHFLKEPITELCLNCHVDLRSNSDGSAWTTPHSPVEEGKCRFCHHTHSSRQLSLLKSAMPQTCRPCHQEFFEKLESTPEAKRHKPVREGECAACHDVHGSEKVSLLKSVEGSGLCTSCHQQMKGGHHLLETSEIEEKSGLDLTERNLCAICHRPHASPQKSLLMSSSSDICQACHRT